MCQGRKIRRWKWLAYFSDRVTLRRLALRQTKAEQSSMPKEANNVAELLLIHDLLPHQVPLQGFVKEWLGDNFVVLNRGTVVQPLKNDELRNLLCEHERHRAFLTLGALPVHAGPAGSGRGVKSIRSFLPIAHPIARVASLY